MTQNDPLSRIFLHQSPLTGNISAARLNLRQLCRLLCPAVDKEQPQGQEESSSISPPQQQSTGATQVLEVLPDGSYSPAGWVLAHEIPILGEALAQWWIEDGSGSTTGPLTCRQIAQRQQSTMTDTTRFYSTQIGSWKPLQEIPNLQAALQAFTVPCESASTQAAAPKADTTVTAEEMEATAAAFRQEVKKDDNRFSQPDENATSHEVKDELEAFLASTDRLDSHGGTTAKSSHGKPDNDEDDEGYESDGGTRYVKDWRTGNWVHEALVGAQRPNNTAKVETKNTDNNSNNNKRPNPAAGSATTTTKKRKKSKFTAKNAKCWVYVTGLPSNATEQQVATFFAKVGILDLDPETQRPKVKVYRYKDGHAQAGQAKGDASVCFARVESVELALTILDDALFRPETDLETRVHVERAKFEQQGDAFEGNRIQKISKAKRKVAQMAVKQAMDWDGGEHNGRLTGGLKGLRIIVLQPLFGPNGVAGEEFTSLVRRVRDDCETCGAVEKITVFASNPRGVVVVKFTQPVAASDAIKRWNGRQFDGRKVEATFFDGVTDYTIRNEAKEEAEMEKRHEEFGNWLESQEIPEELRLNVET